MGIANDFELPPADASIEVVNDRGDVVQIGKWPIAVSFRRSKPWLDWFNALRGLAEQITILGDLDFGNTAAQTSSTELTISFTIGQLVVPTNSFLIMRGPLDNTTEAPIALTSGTFFTFRMVNTNSIGVRFHNFSAGAIDPARVKFEFLIILRKS